MQGCYLYTQTSNMYVHFHVCSKCVHVCALPFSLMRENDEKNRDHYISSQRAHTTLSYYQGRESLITDGDRQAERKENM